jgi:hypothetical protein
LKNEELSKEVSEFKLKLNEKETQLFLMKEEKNELLKIENTKLYEKEITVKDDFFQALWERLLQIYKSSNNMNYLQKSEQSLNKSFNENMEILLKTNNVEQKIDKLLTFTHSMMQNIDNIDVKKLLDSLKNFQQQICIDCFELKSINEMKELCHNHSLCYCCKNRYFNDMPCGCFAKIAEYQKSNNNLEEYDN